MARPKRKAPTIPVKLTTWYREADKVSRLREILGDEAMQLAMAILKEAAGPTVTGLNADPQVNSHRMAWYAGYRDAFNDLEKLTTRPSTNKTNNLEEWTHL